MSLETVNSSLSLSYLVHQKEYNIIARVWTAKHFGALRFILFYGICSYVDFQNLESSRLPMAVETSTECSLQ